MESDVNTYGLMSPGGTSLKLTESFCQSRFDETDAGGPRRSSSIRQVSTFLTQRELGINLLMKNSQTRDEEAFSALTLFGGFIFAHQWDA